MIVFIELLLIWELQSFGDRHVQRKKTLPAFEVLGKLVKRNSRPIALCKTGSRWIHLWHACSPKWLLALSEGI